MQVQEPVAVLAMVLASLKMRGLLCSDGGVATQVGGDGAGASVTLRYVSILGESSLLKVACLMLDTRTLFTACAVQYDGGQQLSVNSVTLPALTR